MSEMRRRRADAERSREGVLLSAIRLLGDRPDATLEEIAAAAGVTRQTVYAHFRSRRALLGGVVERLTTDYLAALDAAHLDEGPPAEALARLIDVSLRSMRDWSPLLASLSASLEPVESERQHAAVLDRVLTLARRGQASGAFDDRLPAEWLAAATIALSHAVVSEAAVGRLGADEVEPTLVGSLVRLYGCDGAAPGDAPRRSTGTRAAGQP